LSNGLDLLDLLLSAVDDEGKPFTDQEIKEEALTFVLAGACREEVDRILPNGKLPTNDNLTDLVICEAIINETLRLYPPAPVFTRYCIREHIIGDEHPIRIPVGATILISDYLLHRRNDLWPRADGFDYTRWMRDPKTGLKPKLPHPFCYLPFAAGPRNCIGQNFALLEAKIMLSMFVQRCNFEMVPGQKIIPDVTITMCPKYRLLAMIRYRKSSLVDKLTVVIFMAFQILLYIPVVLALVTIAIVYLKLIRPEKRVYDIFRAQGINGEPFVPLIGQLPSIRRYREVGSILSFQEDLAKKHGNLFLYAFGPLTRLVITEPDLLADMFSRRNVQNYIKPPLFNTVFSQIIGEKNLLVAEGNEHERARRMINPAFYHINLKSMVSIITDQTARTIDRLIQKSTVKQKDQISIDLQNQFNALTLSIIASSAFGSGFETITNAQEIIHTTFGEVLEAILYRSLLMINQIPFISKFPFCRKNIVDKGIRIISDFVNQIIAERRQGKSASLSN
ncbi:unnamed protein product, partial [Rotaria magnacalcarata]